MAAAGAAGVLAGLREEAGQWAFLTRHFFNRMFRNEVVDFEDQMKERLIAALSILAIIIFWSSELLLFKYHFVPDTNVSWQEKTYIITLVMIIFGIITLLEWDVLFPDRQDFLNLTPLPVRLRTIFFGKLASFALFIGLFSAAMNSGASVLFSLYLTQWRAEGNLGFAAWYAVSHLLATFAACAFVFFGCVCLQFLLMAILPYQVYRRLSLFLRSALVAVFIFLLLAFLIEPAILDKSFHSMARLKEAGGPFFFRFPPFWFVGLYERLIGTPDPMFAPLARRALLAILLSLSGFAAASALSYYRHVRKTLETSRRKRRLAGLRDAWEGVLGRAVLRRPEERAVYGFFTQTLRTSHKHRITMAYYLAVGAGVIMLYAVVNREEFRLLTPSNLSLLGQPLFMAFVILAGLRTMVNIPAWPAANWVFEVTETGRTAAYVAGLKKAVIFRWLVPFAGLVLASHLFLWKFAPAFGHALFVAALSVLGVEGFFRRFRKVPFACASVPGKVKVQFWLVPFALIAFGFLSLATRTEKSLLGSPVRMFLFLAMATAVWLVIDLRNRRTYRNLPLIFEEEPEPAMVTFPERP